MRIGERFLKILAVSRTTV